METIAKLQKPATKPVLPVPIAVVLYLTVFFYLTFPKAGIKIEGIPLSIGDLLFSLLILFCLTRVRYWMKTFYKFKTIIILLMISSSYILLKLGYVYWNSGLYKVDVIVPLLIYPIIFLVLLLLNDIYEFPWKRLLFIPVIAFILLSFYALMQVCFGVETVMVPGLTYNWTDAHTPHILTTKNNYYGTYTKIFSTYQNGNLFGVNLLLIFPLVFELVYRKSRATSYLTLTLFIIVALLTASRAVWAGVVVYVLVRFFLLNRSWGRLSIMFPLSLISLSMLFIEPLRFRANMFLGKDRIPQLIHLQKVETTVRRAGGGGKKWARETADMPPQIEDLSGREGRVLKLWNATFGSLNWEAILLGPYGILPRGSFGITGEMVYAAIFTYFGLIGLILWLLPFLFSITSFFYQRNDYIIRGIVLGLITYFVVATVEGAFWLCPTAFNLWLILGIGWLKWHHLQNQGTNTEGLA